MDDSYEVPILFTGDVTWVELVQTIQMRSSCLIGKERERRPTCSKNVEQEMDSGAVRTGGLRKGIHGKPRLCPRHDESDNRDCDETIVMRGAGCNLFCRKCEGSFASSTEAERHAEQCKIPFESCIFSDRAVRMAKELIERNVIVVHTKSDDNPTFNSIEVTEDVRSKTKFKPYWALRPTQGVTMGANFVGYCRNDIIGLVDAGYSCKGAKKSSAQVQEILRARNPMRLDILSTYHINNLMKSHLSKGRRLSNMTPEELLKASSRKPQIRIYGQMAECREEIIRADISKPVNEIPAAMRAALSIKEGNGTEDFPPILQLTRKVYSLRSKIRAETGTLAKREKKKPRDNKKPREKKEGAKREEGANREEGAEDRVAGGEQQVRMEEL